MQLSFEDTGLMCCEERISLRGDENLGSDAFQVPLNFASLLLRDSSPRNNSPLYDWRVLPRAYHPFIVNFEKGIIGKMFPVIVSSTGLRHHEFYRWSRR